MLSMNEGLQPNFFVFSTLLVSEDRYLRDEGIRSSLKKIDAALGGDLSAFTKQADEEGKKKPTKEEEGARCSTSDPAASEENAGGCRQARFGAWVRKSWHITRCYRSSASNLGETWWKSIL